MHNLVTVSWSQKSQFQNSPQLPYTCPSPHPHPTLPLSPLSNIQRCAEIHPTPDTSRTLSCPFAQHTRTWFFLPTFLVLCHIGQLPLENWGWIMRSYNRRSLTPAELHREKTSFHSFCRLPSSLTSSVVRLTELSGKGFNTVLLFMLYKVLTLVMYKLTQ